jgi:carboxynorspermidine decarboxylase
LAITIKVTKLTDNGVTQSLRSSRIETPAFVYDLPRIQRQMDLLAQMSKASGCRPIYSIKSLPCENVLQMAGQTLGAVSVSSLYESRWAREVLGDSGRLHLTTPGLRDSEAREIADLCDYVSFNSVQQAERLLPLMQSRISCGLRVNPQLSVLDDERYDPCRPRSKLGIPVSELGSQHELLQCIEGLHFHTSFGAPSFSPLRATLDHLIEQIPGLLNQVKWLNLGGGYVFSSEEDLSELTDIVRRCREDYQIEVFFEPGKAIVGEAGYLVSSVIDVFQRDGSTIAVLDTSVNHLPEVFEYQRPPTLHGDTDGEHRYLLAGSSCLSGDLFGEYGFDQALQVGDRIIFADVGAYSLVKAHRFNGYGLPALYILNEHREVILQRRDEYADYRTLWSRQ